MVFTTSESLPKLPFDPPDSTSIVDFIFDERHGRPPLTEVPAPFAEGLSGKEYSALEVKDRVELLARALAEELKWDPKNGTERDRVAGLFTVNTVSLVTVGA